jgi:hypothetical protein
MCCVRYWRCTCGDRCSDSCAACCRSFTAKCITTCLQSKSSGENAFGIHPCPTNISDSMQLPWRVSHHPSESRSKRDHTDLCVVAHPLRKLWRDPALMSPPTDANHCISATHSASGRMDPRLVTSFLSNQCWEKDLPWNVLPFCH